MISIYIGSTQGYSGKSLVALGLALRMKEDGIKVGFMKPYGRVPTVTGGVLTDGDVSFMKKTLGLAEPVEKLCPVVYSRDLMDSAVRGKAGDLKKKVMRAYDAVSAGKDVMLVGGARDVHDGMVMGIAGKDLVEAMDAKAVIVEPLNGEFCFDCLLAVKEALGPRLLGVVVNRVPPDGIEHVRRLTAPFLKKNGIALFGILPSDKVLNSVTVGQINESLGGTVLCSEDKVDELVENFSIGAMDVESAIKYFRRIPNKAVITGGHRSDIQLAALETSTKCLVLTGDLLPNDLIIAKARLAGVPVITVRHDTLSAVERLESMLGKTRIREEKKVGRAMELMREHFDYAAFYKKAGIKK